MIDQEITVITNTPEITLIGTLSEIGGLIVVFRISAFILGYAHQYLFDRKMKMGDRDFKSVYSFANFDDALKQIDQL